MCVFAVPAWALDHASWITPETLWQEPGSLRCRCGLSTGEGWGRARAGPRSLHRTGADGGVPTWAGLLSACPPVRRGPVLPAVPAIPQPPAGASPRTGSGGGVSSVSRSGAAAEPTRETPPSRPSPGKREPELVCFV